MRYALSAITCAVVAIGISGCGPTATKPNSTGSGASGSSSPSTKYVVLETRTDNFDFGAAKALPEESIASHPELTCMVGLFAYNPPYMLEALKGADKLGKIKLIGFDEADETLQAIVDGHCYGTVVQNPYMYGHESVRILAALARKDESVLPEGGFLDIPARKITKENVGEFWDELKRLTKEDSEPAQPENAEAAADKPTVAFVTNGIASFWVIAEKGAQDAAKKFDVKLLVRMPPSDGAVANQKRMIEELLTLGVDGMAVSPIDPDNQTDVLNAAAAKTRLITHDSDAPKSNRICYVGMDNYTAGRMCGELVKEAIPDGGKVAIFVGRLEQLNAKLRNQGVVDELLDQPRTIGITGQPLEPETEPAKASSESATEEGDNAKAGKSEGEG